MAPLINWIGNSIGAGGAPWSSKQLASPARTLLSEWDVSGHIYLGSLISNLRDEMDLSFGSSIPLVNEIDRDTTSYTDNGGGSFSIVGAVEFGFSDVIETLDNKLFKLSFDASNVSAAASIRATLYKDTAWGVARSGNMTFNLSEGSGSYEAFSTGLLADASTYISFHTMGGIDLTISNIKVEQDANGNDFTQLTDADRPTLTNGGTRDALLSFDGVSEFMSQPVNAGNFQNLTRFEWWGVVYVDQANALRYIYFNDNGAATANDRVAIFADSSGKLSIITNDDGVANQVKTDSAISIGYHIAGFIFTGSEWKIYVDGVLAAISVVAGANLGFFVGSLTNKTLVDSVSVASDRLSSPFYSPNKEKGSIMFGGTTDAALSDAAERTNIFNYLNQRHNLGL